LAKPELLGDVRETGIEIRDFHLDAHQKIFEVICFLSDTHHAIDLVTVQSSLRDRGWLDVVGGSMTLTTLFDSPFQYANVIYYAKIVRAKALQRRMIDVCANIINEGFEGVENTEQYIDSAEAQVFEVAQLKVSKDFASIQHIVGQNLEEIQRLYALGGKAVTGLQTGFTDFDKVTTGLHPGQVMVLAARPGMGKTAWFMSAILHACVTDKKVVAVFSLEMSKEELGNRLLSSMLRVDNRRIRTATLTKEEFRRAYEVVGLLEKAHLHVDDSPGIGVLDIRTKCRRLKAKLGQIDLVVIDYLQIMGGMDGGKGKNQSREQEISAISRGLKLISKELGVPVIALSQLSRETEKRNDKRPMLSDLRESGAIEQDADIVAFIHREEYYNKESDQKGIAELIIAKNRHGEQRTVKMAWMPQYTLFANLASDDAPEQLPTQQKPARADDVFL
jgi:replicative DNA helicase